MSVSSSEPGGDGWLRLGGVVELVVEQVLGDGRVSVCDGMRQVEHHGQVQRVWPDGQGLVKDPVPAQRACRLPCAGRDVATVCGANHRR